AYTVAAQNLYNKFINQFLTWYLVFFFQAKDGIRDYKVTGVQTCALPISPTFRIDGAIVPMNYSKLTAEVCQHLVYSLLTDTQKRSEERRVGKECRSWCASYS